MDLTKAETGHQFVEADLETDDETVRRVKYNSKMSPRNRYYNIYTGKKIAVIFNHTKFLFNRISNLENNNIDINRLKQCFKHIGFDVRIHENITADEMDHEMDKIGELESSNVSCLIIAVLSHGSEGYLEAYDKSYKTSILWDKLAGKLIGIPKLYFIDACRGTKMDQGVEVTDSMSTKAYKFKLPTMADHLFMYATIEGHVSFMSRRGSTFINYLCHEILQNHKMYDLLQILTFVCQDVAVHYDAKNVEGCPGSFKLMPQIVSMLTKLLRFDVISTSDQIETAL